MTFDVNSWRVGSSSKIQCDVTGAGNPLCQTRRWCLDTIYVRFEVQSRDRSRNKSSPYAGMADRVVARSQTATTLA